MSARPAATLTITEAEAGQRLDHVLTRLLPGMGLRGRRRLCELGGALLNGRPAAAARKTRAGDILTLVDQKEGVAPPPGPDAEKVCAAFPVSLPAADCSRAAETDEATPPHPEARVIRCSVDLAALFKPAGMHSASLAGKTDRSLQSLLPVLLPPEAPPSRPIPPVADNAGTERSEEHAPAFRFPVLLNRLDCATSGLVMAARNAEGQSFWHTAQQAGQTRKRYLALLEGAMTGPALARQRLVLKGRERVLVELAVHPDERRHTALTPLTILTPEQVLAFLQTWAHAPDAMRLCPFDAERAEQAGRGKKITRPVTLAGCVLLKGARHQIRAHASALGHPLLGDGRYGAACDLRSESPVPPENDERFFLHHGRVDLPGFTALCPPPWLPLLPPAAAAAGQNWLAEDPPRSGFPAFKDGVPVSG